MLKRNLNFDIENLGESKFYSYVVPHIEYKIDVGDKIMFGYMTVSEFNLTEKIKELLKLNKINNEDANELTELINNYGEDRYKIGSDDTTNDHEDF